MDQTNGRSCGRRRPAIAALLLALALGADSTGATTMTPLATPASPTATGVATPAATPTVGVLVTGTTSAPTATPLPSARPTPVTSSGPDPDTELLPPAEEAAPVPIATSLAARPRTFRTPERAAPPAFVAPQAAPPSAPNGPAHEPPGVGAPPSRSTAALVVFRATARTALEGFDLRVGYPRALGTFVGNGHPADCSAGTGAMVIASDRGDGQLRLIVASAQALPFPLDVFCRFALAPGAGIDAAAFDVRIAEVTSNAKGADPSLLIVDIAVR